MVNKSKRARKTRKSNPLERSQGIPRPILNFDGSMLSNSLYVDASNTTLGVARDFHLVDCDGVYGIARNTGAMTQFYSEFKFMQVSLEWIPKLGPSATDAGGRIHIAYIDNPEKISTYANAAPGSTTLGYVRGSRNCKSYNLWERFTYNVPITFRKKMFDVNQTLSATTAVDEIERSVQGAIIIHIETVSAAIVAGTYHIRSKCVLRGMNAAIPT